MKSIQLFDHDGLRTLLLVMDDGDEPFALITEFAQRNDITGASLTAIGACRAATIGYFDPDLGDYRRTRFDEQLELASCMGDIATTNDDIALRAYVVLGRVNSSALAGHLLAADVFPTMEVVLTEVPMHLRKRIDPRTGLALISPAESSPT